MKSGTEWSCKILVPLWCQMEVRVYSTGVYVPKESYTLNIKKSRKNLAEPLNRNQNNTVDLKKN